MSLSGCSHDYRNAKETLKSSQLDSWAIPINPEPLQYAPLIPRTYSELERQAAEEEEAIQILKRLSFTP